jgi:hypothetical protein
VIGTRNPRSPEGTIADKGANARSRAMWKHRQPVIRS